MVIKKSSSNTRSFRLHTLSHLQVLDLMLDRAEYVFVNLACVKGIAVIGFANNKVKTVMLHYVAAHPSHDQRASLTHLSSTA